MHWIYILECENGYYYVGETSRLFGRGNEHFNGFGGVNTSLYTPIRYVAIYKLHKLAKYIELHERHSNGHMFDIYFKDRNFENFIYNFNEDTDTTHVDHRGIENDIAERLIDAKSNNWTKIRGGKYIRLDIEYDYPTQINLAHIPLCNCGFPCGVHHSNNRIHFRCSKREWPGFEDDWKPCNYYQGYLKDNNEFKNKGSKIKALMDKSPWLKNLVGRMDEYCVGGCGKEYDGDNIVRHGRRATNFCFDCFLDDDKREVVKNKFRSRCMIIGDD